jgi:prenyl protein peptidase
MAPTGVYARLKASLLGEKEPELPPLNTATAIALLILYTLIYVLPFYISSTTRHSPSLSRDAPSVIRGRIRLVTISCLICSVTTFVTLSSIEHGIPINSLHLMGYFPVGVKETVKTVGLTAILFAGPLFEAGIARGAWRDWIRLRGVNEVISGWIGWRNYVAGPLTEEILFRSASVPLLLLARMSSTKIIFLTPVIFGLAHVHHFYEFRITHPHTPIVAVLLRSLLQFSYTTLFGGYVTFIYMRTGSLLSVILIHQFCNWRGLPRFWGRISAVETVIGPDVGEGKRNDGPAKTSDDGSLGIVWDVAYYLILVVGAVAWEKSLWSLTESASALVMF